jgi:uncharacterized damage-inducible protein DinB
MSPDSTQPIEKSMTVGNTLSAELQYEAISTRKMLERVPDEFLGWKPHEKSMELRHIARHLAMLPSFVKPTLTSDEFDLAASPHQTPVLERASDLVEAFDNNLSEAVEFLSSVSDEDLTKTWRLRNGEKTIFEMPRAAVIRSLVLSHLIHHRGQLSVYLRLQNVPVPSIYGPSADEQ